MINYSYLKIDATPSSSFFRPAGRGKHTLFLRFTQVTKVCWTFKLFLTWLSTLRCEPRNKKITCVLLRGCNFHKCTSAYLCLLGNVGRVDWWQILNDYLDLILEIPKYCGLIKIYFICFSVFIYKDKTEISSSLLSLSRREKFQFFFKAQQIRGKRCLWPSC